MDSHELATNSYRNWRIRVTRALVRRMFGFMERHFDIHVTMNNYYSPIPSVKDLPDDLYDRHFSLKGVDLNEDGQLTLLNEIFPTYIDEFTPSPNGGLSLVDAYVLYAMIRRRKPRKMVEIGGGDSTFIAMRAIEQNRAEGDPCHFTCIEPYPRPFLKDAHWPDYELRVEPVQETPLSCFADADMVFIDSSHVCKIGSDVTHEMLEIVPSLPIGCYVHWHDIVMPTNYWRDWTRNGSQFWNESYFLHAFLLFNKAFSVRWAARHMKLHHNDMLSSRFPYLRDEHRLTSFWVERVE